MLGSGSHRRAASSLAGVYCEAECRDMMAGPDGRDRHSCAVSGHALDSFYCSPQVLITTGSSVLHNHVEGPN